MNPNGSEASCRSSHRLALFFASALALIVISGCSLIFPPGDCPSLDEMCPDLQCDDFAISDGCAICQCDEPDPEPTVCWDSADCNGGQVCNTVDFCETPPGCDEDQPCPAVCYGRCVDPPEECFSDGDCDEGEICRFGSGFGPEERPSPAACAEDDPNCNGDALIAVAGFCVPGDCEERFDFPACPPGTVPTIDFSVDPCGNPVCRPVDDCRNRDVNECDSTPGCRLEELPEPCDCATDPGEPDGICICPVELVCVPDDVCAGLSPDECFGNPNCEGFFIDRPVTCFEECEAGGECRVVCPDGEGDVEGDFICTNRVPQDDCRGDFDCRPDQRCERTVRCDEANCFETPNGDVICEDFCEEFGTCVDVGISCFELPPEQCLDDPRCELADNGGGAPCFCDPDDVNCGNCGIPEPGPVCVPRQPQGCFDDFECRSGERCDLTTTCPPCADGSDPSCAAPCFIEGVCVPQPTECLEDSECGAGFRCEVRELCPPCAAPDPNDPNPPVCECFREGQCVPEDSFCFSDFDCADDQFCDFSDPFCGGPNPGGLVACGGVCSDRDPVPPGVCLENSDCNAGERCATELDVCVCPANDPDCLATGICFSQCVPLDNGDSCFEDADCREGLTCDTQNFCDPPPDCPQCTVCAGRCVDPNDPTAGFCQSDFDCAATQHCGFEVEPCTQPPGTNDGQCWSVCVDDSPSTRLCLEDGDCPQGSRCASEQDICFCPDNTTCEVCFAQCVEL